MTTDLVLRPGVDSAFLAWRAPFIKNCRGFSLTRRVKRAAGSTPSPETIKKGDDGFAIELVSSWVGFANGPKVDPGMRKTTTEWPIQKCTWSDFMVGPGDQVAYRVAPMVGDADSLKEDAANGSPWTDVVEIGATTRGGISCYFNRGIVASQWLSRLLPKADPATELRQIIATPGDKTRNFLGGPVNDKLTSLLNNANHDGGHVFAALFELDDPELIPLLQALGKRAHVLLGNGSVNHKGDDENAQARETLRMCDVHNRMTAPRALAHNKFLVICDWHETPQVVRTGSTNWTMTGLCTQANNAVLVQNALLAHDYLEQWKMLVECEDASPASLLTSDATPLLIIEGDSDLASQYAGNIMQIYNQYRWRQSVQAQHGKPAWEGLADDDKWQIGAPGSDPAYDKRRLRELDFWFGKPAGGQEAQDGAQMREADGHPPRGEAGQPSQHRRRQRGRGH
ncbi:MAG TPA: hypothetical protein VJY34_24845 [Roseiarcus sp.]|nr:hypothetical protein [Roseiarcus sp.]